MIEYLLFDLGNVLVELKGMPLLREIYPNLSDLDIKRKWKGIESVEKYETGKINTENFLKQISSELGLDLTKDESYQLFESLVGEVYKGTLDFLRQVKKRYKIGCFSNTNPLHISKLRKKNSFLNEFDDIFLSYKIGYAKPQIEAYEHVLKFIKVPPDKIVFFDDKPINVKAAQNIGIKAYIVQGLDDLIETVNNYL